MSETIYKEIKLFQIIKKISLSFLITSIICISIIKALIMIQAAILYASTGVPWFETLNYILLAIAILTLPPLALFYLDSEHIRRLLRFYLLIVIFFDIFELTEGIFSKIGSLWRYERTFVVILILIEFFSAVICWVLLLRQIGGHSLLPIPINTKMYVNYTVFEFLFINPIKNIMDFVKKSPIHNRKRTNMIIFVNIMVFSSLILAFIPENQIITIKRPENHQMRISFWGGNNFDNSTLDILSEHNSRIFVWDNPLNQVKWERFFQRNIDTIIVKGFESNESRWEEDLNSIESIMDSLDSQNSTSVVGFTDDMEMLTRLIEYNQTYYEKYVNFIQNKTNYVRSRGYEYHITQWLASLNDYRDKDNELSVVYKNPFDPIKFANISSIGWMVYRSEMAIKYDEPFDYFTHHWATQVYNYMDYIEKQYNYADGFWKNKSSISIGVAEESSPYTFNFDLNPDARENFLQELKICHANRISEVIIFYAGQTNANGEGLDGFVRLIGGNEGLIQMYNELSSYEEVEIHYHRRATFFGNLKMLSNASGSVFGLLYSDVIYNSSTGFLVFFWLAVFLISSTYIHKHNFTQDRKISKEQNFDRNSCYIRVIFLLVLVIFTIVVYSAFEWPEFLIIIRNLDYYLKIFF